MNNAEPEKKAEAEKKKTQIVVEEGGLEFIRPDGRLILRLEANADGAALILVGPLNDDAAVSLAVGPAFGKLLVSSMSGATELSSGPDGALIRATAPDGVSGALIAASPTPIVALSLPNGTLAAELVAMPLGGALGVKTAAGTYAGALYASGQGGTVRLSTAHGTPVVEAGADGGDGCLLVTDKTGARVMEIPKWKFTPKTPTDTEPG